VREPSRRLAWGRRVFRRVVATWRQRTVDSTLMAWGRRSRRRRGFRRTGVAVDETGSFLIDRICHNHRTSTFAWLLADEWISITWQFEVVSEVDALLLDELVLAIYRAAERNKDQTVFPIIVSCC
jgi:hypothetical protein